jgi:hypothetical protein
MQQGWSTRQCELRYDTVGKSLPVFVIGRIDTSIDWQDHLIADRFIAQNAHGPERYRAPASDLEPAIPDASQIRD